MQQLLRGVGGAVTLRTYDADGIPANPAAGAITADVVDSAGAAIAGSPFAVANPPATLGVLSFDLPSSQDVLDTYTVTWNLPGGITRTSEFEIIGAYLFEVGDLRAYDAELTTAAYPSDSIVELREAITERFEKVAGVSFVPRGDRAYLDGSGSAVLVLPKRQPISVVAITVDDVALAAEDLADVKAYDSGELVWDGGVWTAGFLNVQVLYEHGLQPVPGPVHRVAMMYAAHELKKRVSEENPRATGLSTDAGFWRLTIAGRDGPTGLPEVDAVLADFGRRAPGGFS